MAEPTSRPNRAPAPRRARASRPPGRVRIIGGRYKRTPIAVVDVPGLRPTPDRVRETVFNWIEHLQGGWAGRQALDLYAGSGALGFECASRGAAQVLLVERDARAVAALRALQQRLACPAVRILAEDAAAALARLAPASQDLVFLDPPFEAGLLPRAVPQALRVLRPGGLLYLESAAPIDEEQARAWGLELLRAERAGAVFYHLLRARSC